MRAFGSDRLRPGEDGAVLLSCRIPKPGWTPRVEKTLTRSEHPGTAVLWEDEYFEVVAAEALPQGVRYTLAPWKDEHTIRVADRYDEESEAARVAEARREVRRTKTRWTVNFLALLSGHLPAAVQERLASEVGVNAPRLTVISTLPAGVLLAFTLRAAVSARMGERAGVPVAVLIFALYMALDSAVRFGIAWLQRRPVGSFPGLVVYAIYYAIAGRRAGMPPPLAPPPGSGIYKIELDEAALQETRAVLYEPLFTLLSAQEQQAIAQRIPYDFRKAAPPLAWGILIFSLFGTVSSFLTMRSEPRFSALTSLIVAGYLTAEQIYRLAQLTERPAGSILGYVARPFVRRVLAGMR